MKLTEAERETIASFGRSYGFARSPVMQAIERSVCGGDYGGTSWTTREEAVLLGHALSLQPAKTLLEIGAGSGWPSLFLAKRFGCSAVLVDLPTEGLRVAFERARLEKLSGRCLIAQADATQLPLAGHAFEAIVHSDVLCCLKDKLGVLRECRRTIREDGRMAFTVIFVAAQLSGRDHADAVAAGPPFVEAEMDYESLLARSGWRLESQIDLTDAFHASMRRMVDAQDVYADQLMQLMGPFESTEWLSRTRSKVPAIARGLIRRAMFVAEPA